MNSGRIMNLRVTIPAESRRMNVGKDVIRILGSPAYICVLQRKDRKSIAITPCAAEHPMSFKVPDRLLTDGQCRMMINGIQFIQALLEAMSYGNCCLVSDIPECAEVVEDKALIFQKSNVEDLQEKLQDACDHPEMVMKMKKQATDFICEKYNWDDVVKETMKLYRRK